jgi:hypothetical protein
MTPALDRLRRPFDHHADGLAVLAERGLTFDDCLDDLDPEALWAVLGGTARRVYGLPASDEVIRERPQEGSGG